MKQNFLTVPERRQLRKQLEATTEAEVYRRTLGLLAIDAGWAKKDVARLLQAGRQTIYDWLNRYQAERSPVALHHHRGQGRPVLWTPKRVSQLRSLLKRSPQDLGYPAALWTIPLLQEQFSHQGGWSVSRNSLRRQLHELGYVWKRFRHVLEEDPQQEKKSANYPSHPSPAEPKRRSGRGRNGHSPLSASALGMGTSKPVGTRADIRKQRKAGHLWNNQHSHRCPAVSGPTPAKEHRLSGVSERDS